MRATGDSFKSVIFKILTELTILHLTIDNFSKLQSTKMISSLNESKGHCKNEVLVNTDRIKYADQFLLPKLDEILNGLWENQGFWRPTIVIYGAAYTSFIQFYLFCWRLSKNSVNAMISSKVSLTKFWFVWLLKSTEFFEKLK